MKRKDAFYEHVASMKTMKRKLTPKQRVFNAALRWHKYHCTQLEGGRCAECTRLYKVIADAARRLK